MSLTDQIGMIARAGAAPHIEAGLRKQITELERRLHRIIAECHNETSGAEEDRGRDTVLATIIRIAIGAEP